MQNSTQVNFFVRVFSLHSFEGSMHLQLNLEVKDLTLLLKVSSFFKKSFTIPKENLEIWRLKFASDIGVYN